MTNLTWTKVSQSCHTAGGAVFVQRNSGGWGQRFNAYCQREWAASVDGEFLRTAAGHIRSFASSEAAKRAAEDAS